MSWVALEKGATVGSRGSENGVILIDEEHSLGARITLERDGASAPFPITCRLTRGCRFATCFSGLPRRLRGGLRERGRVRPEASVRASTRGVQPYFLLLRGAARSTRTS
jgi:hypothetical protein